MHTEWGNRGTTSRWGRFATTAIAASVLALALGGCARPTGTADVTQAPGAKVVSLTPGSAGKIKVVPVSQDLSKGAKDVVQWRNDAGEDVMVIFDGAPVGMLIHAHGWSAPSPVCVTCDKGNFPYKIYHQMGGVWAEWPPDGGPNGPQVVVGD